MRRIFLAIAIGAIALALLFGSRSPIGSLPASAATPAPTSPPLIFQTGFTGATATGFIYGTTGTSAEPCLTAASVSGSGSIPMCVGGPFDSVGSGALRLTDNSGNQSGFVIYDTPLNELEGLQVIFDLFMYNGTGADGISFYIINGADSPTVAGANGGSLGYAQKVGTICCDAPGIVGGFIGIGFDSYGNYSNPTEGRVGGPGLIPETVAIRGADVTSYDYVTGYGGSAPTGLPFTLSYNSSTTRPTAIRVRVVLSTSNVLTVDMDPGGTGTAYQNVIPATDLNAISGQPSFPATFKFGWAASTGGSNDIHEVRNFVSTNAPPDLTITKQHNGPFTKNVNGTYTIQATTDNAGGNADQTIYMTDTLPANETFVSVSGSGWTCNAASPVQCTYPPTVPSGTALPPITLTVTPTKNNVTLSNTACIYSADMYSATGSNYNDCATDTVVVGASSPFITIWKRITQIIRSYGNSTPQTITPTPDPGSSPGLLGTASTTNIDPGDLVTYTIYYSNTGTSCAGGAGSGGGACSGGPTLSDLLSPNYVYQTGTDAFTCCANPTSANSATFSSTLQSQNTLLQWVFANPLAPANATNAIEGSAAYQVKVP